MVDNLVCISNCGLNSVLMNAFINAKTNIKKLQFGASKCHKMHVGAKNLHCPELTVDSWKVTTVEDFDTGEKVLKDEFDEAQKMESSETEKYLGDLISSDGKNYKNIQARKSKGHGILNQIGSILDGTVFGPFIFEVALILRSSLLLNGILTNSEAWYGLEDSDIEELEQVDEIYLRKILEVGSGCPKEMLYLETGSIPIRFIIICRRLMFLHYILNEDSESLIYKCLEAQMRRPCRNDWINSVEKDFKELDIMLTFEDIKALSKQQFKTFVDKTIEQKALEYLNKIKLKHSKVLHIEHTSLNLQEYLQPQNIQNIPLAKFIFHARTRMLDVRMNFRNKYKNDDIKCPLKCDTEDDQKHLLECDKIMSNLISTPEIAKYEDLFAKDVTKQITIAGILEEKYKNRKKLLI